MKIVDIFAVVNNSLFSVQYEGEGINEFRRLLTLWNDIEYLRSLLNEHSKDLETDFWGDISVRQAALNIRRDASNLERKLIELAKEGLTNRYETLSQLFKPLDDRSTGQRDFENHKSYGIAKPSMIRLYAIRLDNNRYVISGGAIKLCKGMEREHLQYELRKLQVTHDFCREYYDLAAGYFEIS
jgi:hypothetical protein